MKKLPRDFYSREDVVLISEQLIGKVLCTNVKGRVSKGIITETEAYTGVKDKASHAYGGRRTERTEVMYGPPGISYVYLCYGVHSLFNVITNQRNIPHAVLIRGIYPIEGFDNMVDRRKIEQPLHKIADGPGKMSQAMGIEYKYHNCLDLLANLIWIEDHGIEIPSKAIKITPRIGIDYAQEDALLPYRFLLTDPHINLGLD